MSVSTLLKLPVFDDTETLCHHFNLAQRVRDSFTPFILRHCEISIPAGDSARLISSLEQLLRITENQFDILESEFGIPVVPHKWGLYPTDSALKLDGRLRALMSPSPGSPNYLHKGYHLLPPGMLLAARVAIVDELTCPAPNNENALIAYTSRAQGFFLNDLQSGQGVFGTPRSNPQTTSTAEYIVDIEPRLGFS